MDWKNSIKRRTTAGVLAMTVATAGIVFAITASSPAPTIYVDGLELRMVQDPDGKQSIQALVSVSIENLQYATGASFVLDYNSLYMEPSDWVTNQPYGPNGVNSDGTTFTTGQAIPGLDPVDKADPLHHLFFHTDEELFAGRYCKEVNGVTTELPMDPFTFLYEETLTNTEEVTGKASPNILQANTNNHTVSIALELRGGLKTPTSKNGNQLMEPWISDTSDSITEAKFGSGTRSYSDYCFEEGRITLGTISFRINDTLSNDKFNFADFEAKLRELLKFNNSNGTSESDNDYLVRALKADEITSDPSNPSIEIIKPQMRYVKVKGTNPNRPAGVERAPMTDGFVINIEIDSDDVITTAEPVNKEITINSYQAFTAGEISDLAFAMQKYAESVRVNYVSGKKGDMSIYWGDPVVPPATNMPADGPGMLIRRLKADGTVDETGPCYRFTWASTGTGYILESKLPDGSFAPVTNPSTVYGPSGIFTPLGGDYMISQYFTYQENEGISGNGGLVTKALQTPLEVKLHVTPIHVIDASVDRRLTTYRNHLDEVPQHYSALDLANVAKLTLDTTLNGVVPTMPVTWTPSGMASGTPWVLDSTVTGVAGTGNPNQGTTNIAAWPIGQTAIDSETGIGDYTFNTTVLETDIQTAYPWLTTSTDYALESQRRIVQLVGDPDDPDNSVTRYVMQAEPYENPLGSEVAQLRIYITKQQQDQNTGNWEYVDIYTSGGGDCDFKFYMPNDQQIMLTPNGWFGSTGQITPGNHYWTDANTNTSYTLVGLPGWGGSNGKNAYRITISPGDLDMKTNDPYYTQRETLRRYINLGGWFSAQVQEPGQTTWSDVITAYSQPRTNIYIKSYTLESSATATKYEDYLFEYTGDRAGLMPFYKTSDLSTFVTLPADDHVETRYDALTGAQPGTLRQFKVEPSASSSRWPNIAGESGKTGTVSVNGTVSAPAGVGPEWDLIAAVDNTPAVGEIVTYGSDLFARSYKYSNFGTVVNPDTNTITGYSPDVQDRKVTVRVQVQDKKDPSKEDENTWDLLLTYEQTGDNVLNNSNGEVERVTFEPAREGYTSGQIVTLTLTNNGNVEIRGLRVDIPTLPGASGPYFKIIDPLPAVLPAGAKTTFQISYVPNLSEGTYANLFEYNDPNSIPIHIYHDNSGDNKDGADPAKEFEAIVRVTKKQMHKVTIVVHPNVDNDHNPAQPFVMGDAGLVEGITTDTTGVDTYSGLNATNGYVEGEDFWILTTPEDEYSLLTMKDSDNVPHVWVYYVKDGDPTGERFYLNEYLAGGPNAGFGTPDGTFQADPDGRERLFWIDMPDQSVTVHVHYYEPLLSKLRIKDLHAYAWDYDDEIVENVQPDGSIPAAAWVTPNPLGTQPGRRNYDTERELHERQGSSYPVVSFDSKKDEYIVILDSTDSGNDNYCGVSIQLRDLVTHINGIGDPDDENNVDIYPSVLMELDNGSTLPVCNDYPITVPGGGYDPSSPSTVVPTTHRSRPFAAPREEDGQTKIAQTTVTITISYDGTDLVPEEGEEKRVYKVRFVRKMNSEDAMHEALPGNSPYGMIENDDDITDKQAAKDAFDVANRFAAGYTPVRAQEANLTNIYWPEAWDGGVNYDKDETALFVYIGEDFYDPGAEHIYNNAGDYIDGITVTRSLQYYAMDISATTAMDRFNSVTTKTVTLGTVPAIDGAIPGVLTAADGVTYDGMVDFKSVTDIRPGVYKLTYTYLDYDGVSELKFTRPLIVLSHNGDVNADLSLLTDATEIRARFSAGLPHMNLLDTVYNAADKLVYRYRIVDANNDRNINNVDANMVRKVTTLLPSSVLTQFYRPVEYTNPVKP